MLIPNQLVEVKIRKNYIDHYKSLGYDVTSGDIIYVPPEHLPNGSGKIVQVVCDICSKHIDKPYDVYLRTHKYNMDTCRNCKFAKSRLTNLEKYGVEHPTKSDEVKQKTKITCQERYGGDGPMSSKYVQLKSQQTNLQKYGTTHRMQRQEEHEHFKQTMLEKYGVENPSQLDEFKEKKKETCLKHFGVDTPSKSDEIQAKIRETMSANGSVATSSQQIKLYNMIKNKYPDAVLNYPFSNCSLDVFVCVNNTPIDVEYDCWYFHQDISKDVKRDKFLQSHGFKTIRIRSAYQIPDEQEIFETIDYLAQTDHQFKEIILPDWRGVELCQKQ